MADSVRSDPWGAANVVEDTFALSPDVLAAEKQLPPKLLDALIDQESGGNPNAIGKAGEIGLGQLKLNTASDYGITDEKQLRDPTINRPVTAAHLLKMINAAGGDVPSGLGMYNQGATGYKRPSGKLRGTSYAKQVLKRLGDMVSPATVEASEAPSVEGPDKPTEVAVMPKGLRADADPMDRASLKAASADPWATAKVVAEPESTKPNMVEEMRADPLAAYVEATKQLPGMEFVQKHPYLTAAGIGVATGGAGALAEGAGLAGTALAAGMGAGEQMAYQYGAEKVARAMPGHPYLAAAIGMLGPLLGRRFMSSLFGVNAAKKVAAAAATDAQDTIVEKAAQATEAAGQDRLKETALVSKTAQEELPAYEAAKTAGVEKTASAAAEAAKQETAVSEAARQRNELLPRTSEETARAINVRPQGVAADPEHLARVDTFRKSYFQPRERISETFGEQYGEIEKLHGDKKTYPAPIRDVLDKWHDPLAAELKSGEPVTAIQKLRMDAGSLAPELSDATKARVAEGVQSAETASFTQLRNLKRAAQRIADHAGNDRDAQIANDIADAADKSLENVKGLPKEDLDKLRGLNRQWRDFKETFSRKLGREVATNNEPAEVVPKIVGDPKLAQRLFSVATDEEKAPFRAAFNDWANQNRMSLSDIGKKVSPETLKAMGYTVPHEAWLQMEPKFVELQQVLSSPQAQKQFGEAYQQTIEQLQKDAFFNQRKETIALANKLGPIGKPISAAALKARTPQELGPLVQQLGSLTPEQVAKAMGASMATPEEAGLAAAKALPQPGDAARKAIMGVKPGQVQQTVKRLAAYKLATVAAIMLGGAYTGHGASGYAAGIAILATGIAPLYGARTLGRLALRDPRVAELVWQVVKNPKGLDAARIAGKVAAEMMVPITQQNARDQLQQEENKETAAGESGEGGGR